MNICFVYKYYPIDGNYDSGIGKYLFDITQKLKEKHKVIILTTSKKPRSMKYKNLLIYAMPRIQTPKRSISFLLHLFMVFIYLTTICIKEKIDLIEFANLDSEGLIFTIVNKFLKIPVVIRLHTPSKIENHYNEKKRYLSVKLKELIENIFVNQKHVYLTTSTNYNANICKKIYNTKKHIEVIPLGVSIKKLNPNNIDTKRKSIYILYVGRLEKRKGFDTLIKAAIKVLLQTNNTKFIIVGRENNNSEWVNKLRYSIPTKLLDRIIFMGYVPNRNILNKIYEYSDICVVPSRYESFGLVVIEMLSFGKVVVAKKSGGIPEIIKDGENGLLVNSNNPEELSSKIIKLCKDTNLRKRLGKKGLLSIKNKFNLNLLTRNTLKYYRKIINGK